MISINPLSLICPVCSNTLIKEGSIYKCTNLSPHTFDESKEGYVNLLLADGKKSLDPGDNATMVKSRSLFLNSNFFKPVSDRLNDFVKEKTNLISDENLNFFDSGCGEGYYLKSLKKSLGKNNAKYYGLDISKSAIKMAAKSCINDENMTWIVGNCTKIPLKPDSMGGIISVFSPFFSFDELHRIFKDKGYLFVITPNDNHLIQLRHILFDNVIQADPRKILTKIGSKFILDHENFLTYDIHLKSSEDIHNLFKMTPFYWKCKTDKQQKILSLQDLNVTVSVMIWIFTVNKGST